MSFWKDLMEDEPETDDLREMASKQEGWDEMEVYISLGVKYIVDNFSEGGIEGFIKSDEKHIKTLEGIPHCTIVDAAMIKAFDDERLTDYLHSLKKMLVTKDPNPTFEKYRESIHYAMHVGIAIGVGMLIDGGVVQ